MKPKKQEKGAIWYIIISAAIVLLMVFGVISLQQRQNNNTEQTKAPEQSETDGSGDKIMKGADLPPICLTEYSALRARAEKAGASGGLVPDGYDPEKDICLFSIRRLKIDGVSGTVRFLHKTDDGNYGITLEIEKTNEEQVHLWTVASLMFLNNRISENEAREAAETAMSGTPVTADLFSVKIRSSVKADGEKIIPVSIIEIRSVSAPET